MVVWRLSGSCLGLSVGCHFIRMGWAVVNWLLVGFQLVVGRLFVGCWSVVSWLLSLGSLWQSSGGCWTVAWWLSAGHLAVFGQLSGGCG